ncbi:MAG: FlgT C-terminal domain-containing protein [Terriglobales bacterium]
MTKGVIDGNAKIEMRTNKVDALVAFVETGKVVLNVGSTAGLKVGDELTVQRVLQEIKDPSTGKVIRRMMNKLGTVQVSDVDSSSAVCNIVDGAGFKVGDHATTVTQ